MTKAAGGTPPLVTTVIAGSGTDSLYGGPLGTSLTGDVGGTGSTKTFFYNYNPQDNVMGGQGTNYLMFQGDGAINLQHVVNNGQDGVDVTAPGINNGQPLLVGNLGNILGIQAIGVQMLGGTDTTTVNFGSWAGLQVHVQCGSGTDVVDASGVRADPNTGTQAQETLLGGTGTDTIKISTPLAQGDTIEAGTGNDRLVVVGAGNDTVTAAGGTLKVNTYSQIPTAGFQTLEVDGGPASAGNSNMFTSDGSIPNVIFVGGSGTNNFTASGGTNQLIGGSGSNNFTIGPSNSTVLGGSGANALTIQCDNNGDTVHLAQSRSTITTRGSVVGTATNMNSVSLIGGTGNDVLDASGMIMGVTIDGGGGADTIIGGQGNDRFTYRNGGNTYDGGGGTSNVLVFNPGMPGDTVQFDGTNIVDIGSSGPQTFHVPNVRNIEFLQAANTVSQLTHVEDTFATSDWTNQLLPNISYDSATFSSAQGVSNGSFVMTGTDTLNGGQQMYVTHISNRLWYDPLVSGPLSSLSYNLQFSSLTTYTVGPFGDHLAGGSVWAILQQGSSIFYTQESDGNPVPRA